MHVIVYNIYNLLLALRIVLKFVDDTKLVARVGSEEDRKKLRQESGSDWRLPGSIRRLNCHKWPSAGEKSLKLINTPSHSPNDGQASPCLNSHSTHIPIPIACSIPCLVLPHHCPIHAPQFIDSRSLLLFL